MSYFHDIQTGIRTTLKGLRLTLGHIRRATRRRTPVGIASENYFDLQNGLVTLQYPHEQLPIPDNGRYRLRNEIDDCIVCDKCAKVCPVDCITIDAIKATEEVGRASDGSPIRLYAATFDIDMAKCCYCGLCTVVCPTECLTMDKKFDYSEFELGKLTYNFSNLSPEQADEKRSLYEQFLREKEEAKAAQIAVKATTIPVSSATAPENASGTAPKRPVFRPTTKPATPPPPAQPTNSEEGAIEHPLTDATPTEMQQIAQGGLEAAKRPVFRPTQKPVKPAADTSDNEAKQVQEEAPAEKPIAAKPAFRPTMKPGQAATPKPALPEANASAEVKPEPEPIVQKPVTKPAGFRPTMKPSVKELDSSKLPEETKAKPAFRPTMKPANPVKDTSTEQPTPESVEAPKPKPAGFRPTMKPVSAPPNTEEAKTEPKAQPAHAPADASGSENPEPPKPKPAGFRPTMKPKPKSDGNEST